MHIASEVNVKACNKKVKSDLVKNCILHYYNTYTNTSFNLKLRNSN